MSLAFNDTSTHRGIIQKIERTIYGQDAIGRISGNSTLLAQWTADINCALDRAFHIIFQADGRWQFDDSNHTDYPIITTNLVANQRDYSYTTDANSNLILAIQKVAILPSATATLYEEITPADAQTDPLSSFVMSNTTGIPTLYDKTANGIFLDPIPSYNATAGLKLYISREGSYFTTADTTKKPGFAGLYHEYLALYPAWQYAHRNNLANTNALYEEVLKLERDITEHYSKRDEDERDVLSGEGIEYM